MKLAIKTRKHFGSRMAQFRDEIQFEATVTRYATDSVEEISALRQAAEAIKDALRDEGLRIFFRPERVLDRPKDANEKPPSAGNPPTEAQYRALVARLNVVEAQAKAFKAKAEKLMFEKTHGEST